MAIQSDETLVTKGDLKTLYTDKILPYLGGNMMMQTGVSEYYSEDEKIVGVWIDGKPLYQKTIKYETAFVMNQTAQMIEIANTSTWNIDKIIEIKGIAKYNGTDQWVNTNFYPYTDQANIMLDIIHYSGKVVLRPRRTQGTANFDMAYATIKYTKTTDTASSALTTPGCYDLNRPDLWPENKEIFFGNGAYGYRATGTFNTTTDTRESTLLLSLTRTSTTKFISQGGTIKRSVVSPTSSDITIGGPFVSYNLTNGIVSTPFYAVSIEADGIKLWRRDATMSNIPYDLWFTYTK